jgi:hypothetical protein
MEFDIVNNYMGPVATKAMKGYSEEDITSAEQDFKVHMHINVIVLNVNFWVMIPCNLVGYYQCFRGTFYLSPKGSQPSALPHGIITRKNVSEIFAALKIVNLRYSCRPFRA